MLAEKFDDLYSVLKVGSIIKVLDQRAVYCSNKNGDFKLVRVNSDQLYVVVRKSSPERKNVIIEYHPTQPPQAFGFKGYRWIANVIYPDNFKNIVIVND